MGIISNLLFGDNQDKMSYKDAAIKKHYSDITNATYDSMYGGMQDYLDKNYEGGASKYKYDLLGGLKEDADNAVTQYGKDRYNVFGNGLIGSLLNPIVQTGGALGDLAIMAGTGGKDNKWAGDNIGYKRDIGSDLGAAAETALTLVPMARAGSLVKAGKAVQAGTATAKQAAKYAASQVPKSMGKRIAEGALFGAGYGASGSLRDMGFENFDPNEFLTSTATSAGLGAGFAGLGGLWNKYTQPAPGSSLAPSSGATSVGNSKYQGYLKTLKDNGLDTSSADALKKSYRSVIKPLHTDKAVQGTSNEELFKTITDAYRAFYGKNGEEFADAMAKATNPVAGAGAGATYASVPKQSFSEKLGNLRTNLGNTKAGTRVSSILKTKKGKIGAGVGAGLLISKLMNNRNNQNNMSDEQLQELYNYIYRGGQ